MIASLHGRVAALGPDGVVVEVGGVGLAVSCTPGTLAGLRPGQSARLATSLVVREDSLTLYGFADDDERSLFELLQTASGVGPRLAQAVLAVHPPEEVRRAVATADIPALTRVPGIGRKGGRRRPGGGVAGPGADRTGRPRLVHPGGRGRGDRGRRGRHGRHGRPGFRSGRQRAGPAPGGAAGAGATLMRLRVPVGVTVHHRTPECAA